MKLKFKIKRSLIVILALVLAATSSLVVYATVNYDSSQDPVVSLSGMKAYVESVLVDIRNAISSIEARLTALELGSGGSGGGSGEETDDGISSQQLAEIMALIEALQKSNEELKDENEKLSNDISNMRNEYLSLINELAKSYEELSASVSSLGADITNLQNQITAAKNDILMLENNFKQIADISTKLETLTYKVNQLTSSSGDIAKLKNELADLQNQFNAILDDLGQTYVSVFVPYGATIIAAEESDTLSLILRSGTAVAVSPFVEAGTMQGLNDLTLGTDIYNGESIPLFHHIMIPRGGNDGRGVTVTAHEGAYFIIGGNYKIVEG
ncbi:MAG: hypothetical protein ACI3XI_08025 [Eubacteriales bacterium]